MVKVAGPMMSMDASGTIANTATFSKWKGRNYVRQRVIPANPKSGPQTGIRAMMKFLSQYWYGMGSTPQGTWLERAAQTAISPFNAFVAYNLRRFRSFFAPTDTDPAAETGTAPSAPTLAATGGIRQIALAITHGTNLADFGYMIFRAAAEPTPAYSNCIAVIPCGSGGDTTYVDAGLTPGTYHYKARGFLKTGKLGADSADEDGTAT